MTTAWFLSETGLLNLSRADIIEVRPRVDGKYEVRAVWGYRGETLRVFDDEESARSFLSVLYEGLTSPFWQGFTYDNDQ